MSKMLAFDFGASSGRAIIGELKDNKLELREIHRFANEPVTFAKHLQWDILRLSHEVKQSLLKCKNSSEDIESIGVDTWGVDYGLLDERGELLGNPYHYRDSRTEGMIEKLFQIVPKEELFERTGLQVAPYNTIYQLFAAKAMRDKALEQAETLLMTPDLINYMLTGNKVTEYTIASTSQLYNHTKENWDEELMERLGIRSDIFTRIVKPGYVVGPVRESICSELNINPIPVIAVASHDTASAVVSVPAEGRKHVYISSGTWSLLGIESDEPISSPLASKYNFTNEGGADGSIRFLKNIMGLWILQECKRAWEKEGITIGFGDMVDMAQGITNESYIDPDNGIFYGPGNMPEKVKRFCAETGQKVPDSIGEIVRCVEESLALKYRWAIERIEEITGEKIDVIHIVGGGIQDKLLSSLTAKACGRKVVAGPVEATAIGNLIIQGIALGKIKDIHQGREIVRNSFEMKEYVPVDPALWDQKYHQFLKKINA
jgi:rhamnulokinase